MTGQAVNLGLTVAEQVARMDSARLRAYRENLAFYRGQQWPAAQRRRERRLVFNYAKAMIDKSASYLMSGLGFVVDAEDASEEEQARARRAEKALATAYQANNLSQLDFDNEVDVSALGDGAYKVTWDALERRVRVSAPDVQGLFAWWLGDDVSRVWRVASRYSLSHEEAVQLYGGDIANGRRSGRARQGTGARTHVVVEVWTAEEFELWFDGSLLEAKPNPYGFIPFVIYPNLREPKQF